MSKLNKELQNLPNLKIQDFVKLQYLNFLNPFLAYFSVGISILLPIPISILGVLKFRWTTR